MEVGAGADVNGGGDVETAKTQGSLDIGTQSDGFGGSGGCVAKNPKFDSDDAGATEFWAARARKRTILAWEPRCAHFSLTWNVEEDRALRRGLAMWFATCALDDAVFGVGCDAAGD